MWNRVVLLASGMAAGWTLVLYATAPANERGAQRTRLLLSLAVGLLMAILLAVDTWQAGLAGLAVFGLSGLAAYAANAKQVGRVVELVPPRRPQRPPTKDERVAVLLVVHGEPERYTGPGPWAARFRALAAQGIALPGWFVRPWALARVRAAYAAMGGSNPWHTVAAELCSEVQALLGESYVVAFTYLDSPPTLLSSLVETAERGFSQLILAPVDLTPADRQDRLHAAVASTRIREAGVHVYYASPTPSSVWALDAPETRLLALIEGRALVAPTPTTDAARQLAGCVRAAYAGPAREQQAW